MRKLDFYMTDAQHSRLTELSVETGLTVSEHLRRAIDTYLQQVQTHARPYPADEETER